MSRPSPRPTPGLPLALLLAAVLAPAPAAALDDFTEAARAVQAALGEKDPGPLADALWRLRRHDGEPAARVILAAAFRREVPDFVLDAAMDALGAFSSPEAAEVFAAEAARSRDGRRFHALEALGRLQAPRGETALLAHVEDADPRVRTAAVRALADRKEPGPTVRVAAERAALDPDPRVRSAAVHALRRWRGVPSALPLLGRMAAERGRLFGDAWRALVHISRETFPPEPERWADWWRTQPGEAGWHFDAPPPEPPAVSVELAGLTSWSRRVAFVLDTSDGMADRPGYRPEDLVPGEVRREGGRALEEWMGMKSRLDHARLRLGRAVAALPPDASFDLHFGGESPAALFRRLQPATAENRERAASRLRGLNAKERQDFLRLIRSAMAGEPDGDPFSPAAFLEGADTVVYLGSALPSFGQETDGGRILASVRRWNRVRQVQFLCVGVGNHGSDLLAGLASVAPVGASTGIP